MCFTFSGLERRVKKTQKAPKYLKIKCRSPSRREDIGLSIPHRILVILLRRKLLPQHKTLESLLTGTEQTIIIKLQPAHDPVFFTSGAQGLKLLKELLSGFDLEEYYDQELCQWDAVGVMLEGMEVPEAKKLLAQMESATIYRTPLARHSAARHALVEAYLLLHPFYKATIECGVYANIHSAASRIRYGATKAPLQQERAIQKKELSTGEIEKRREDL
ncbi:hypothetical protein LTR17_013092 [Elasticomyces elasticus]|nr:hypothetical protein LTR17_013092 [Elasticomyces elasticus]